MPLGIVSDQDFESELQNSSVGYRESTQKQTVDLTDNELEQLDKSSEHRPSENQSNPIITSDVLPMKSVGRLPDVFNVPQSLRKILGETVVTEGLASAKQLANSLGGLSQPTLSTYANGSVSPGTVNNDLKEYVNGRKVKISKRALNKLNLALSLIDEQKLLGCDAKELSSVAKDMAIVSKQMEPSESKDEGNKDPVQFHFYAPQVRQETHYDVVVAKDNY